MRFINKISDGEFCGLKTKKVYEEEFLEAKKDIAGIKVYDDGDYNVYARSGSKVIYVTDLKKIEARRLAKACLSRRLESVL